MNGAYLVESRSKCKNKLKSKRDPIENFSETFMEEHAYIEKQKKELFFLLSSMYPDEFSSCQDC